VCEIEKNGLPLGLMDVAHYEQLEQPLRVGDRFLLYTDGLLDATDRGGESFGPERVKATLAAGAGLPADGVADAIVDKARAWAAGAAADDLTLVLVDCV
jgi:serine phosphatase RsbU (regulator of sigma subunit)